MTRQSTGAYPDNWPEIAQAVKEAAKEKLHRYRDLHESGFGASPKQVADRLFEQAFGRRP